MGRSRGPFRRSLVSVAPGAFSPRHDATTPCLCKPTRLHWCFASEEDVKSNNRFYGTARCRKRRAADRTQRTWDDAQSAPKSLRARHEICVKFGDRNYSSAPHRGRRSKLPGELSSGGRSVDPFECGRTPVLVQSVLYQGRWPWFCAKEGVRLLSDANDRPGSSPSQELMSAESNMRWRRR